MRLDGTGDTNLACKGRHGKQERKKENEVRSAEGGFSRGRGRPCGGYSDERDGGKTLIFFSRRENRGGEAGVESFRGMFSELEEEVSAGSRVVD